MTGAVSSKPKVTQRPLRKGPSKLTKTYLLAYNVVQTLGWSYLLYQLVSHYLPGNTKPLWDTVWWTVMIFQNAAVLEIVHAATGMVQSGVMTTLLQVYSRVFLVCVVLVTSRGAVESIGLPLSLLAWSVTEIVRYSFYAFNLLGSVPYILQFLRYTLFYALYPIGITGELWCMYRQQGEVAASGMWSFAMPNRFNFIFNYRYFLIIYMLSYIPIFPMLFMHMVNQRKKVLGGGDKKTN